MINEHWTVEITEYDHVIVPAFADQNESISRGICAVRSERAGVDTTLYFGHVGVHRGVEGITSLMTCLDRIVARASTLKGEKK